MNTTNAALPCPRHTDCTRARLATAEAELALARREQRAAEDAAVDLREKLAQRTGERDAEWSRAEMLVEQRDNALVAAQVAQRGRANAEAHAADVAAAARDAWRLHCAAQAADADEARAECTRLMDVIDDREARFLAETARAGMLMDRLDEARRGHEIRLAQVCADAAHWKASAYAENDRAAREADAADEARAECTALMDDRDAHARNADSALAVTRSAIADRDEWRTACLDERRARREAEAALDEATARADLAADTERRLFAVAEERDRELGAALDALFERDEARRELADALTAGNAARDRLAEAEEEIRRLARERDLAEADAAELRHRLDGLCK